MEISSSFIRSSIKEGMDISYLIPEKAWQYIDEMNFYKNNKDRIEIFWGKDKKNWNLSRLKTIFKKKNVYITFDVDGFDASIMPATGTPEPGGLLWEEVLPIIKTVCQVSNIIGVDINELAPIKNFDSYNFLVAKLAYKILSYTFEFKR